MFDDGEEEYWFDLGKFPAPFHFHCASMNQYRPATMKIDCPAIYPLRHIAFDATFIDFPLIFLACLANIQSSATSSAKGRRKMCGRKYESGHWFGN